MCVFQIRIPGANLKINGDDYSNVHRVFLGDRLVSDFGAVQGEVVRHGGKLHHHHILVPGTIHDDYPIILLIIM